MIASRSLYHVSFLFRPSSRLEGRAHNCELVRTEHLLLALATVAKSHSAVILEEAGLSLDRLEAVLSGLPVAEQQAGNSLALEGLLSEMF